MDVRYHGHHACSTAAQPYTHQILMHSVFCALDTHNPLTGSPLFSFSDHIWNNQQQLWFWRLFGSSPNQAFQLLLECIALLPPGGATVWHQGSCSTKTDKPCFCTPLSYTVCVFLVNTQSTRRCV